MASLRRKYQTHFESPGSKDAPVSSPPDVTAAELPEPVADAKPPEQPSTESPADVAASTALKSRLAEMERAAQLSQQPQPPQHAAEPPPIGVEGRQAPQEPQEPTLEQMIAHLPPRVQRWYRAHPEFLTDPEKAAQIQYCHHVARREVGEEMTEPYFDRMEQMLCLRQQPPIGVEGRPQSNGNGRTESAPAPTRPVDRPEQRMAGPAVSAPPSREPPSMKTGRPVSYRAPLTQGELDVAASLGISPQEYAQQKEKMLRLKQSGEMQ